ncbi:phospholipid scramblase 1-like isoform X2 [Paroedura picta]|uniref:phospholipid scramblase 1-like isoform X2 n=1 Tax=Paroedura picta TaxID=143630 RepID=UPI0040567D18
MAVNQPGSPGAQPPYSIPIPNVPGQPSDTVWMPAPLPVMNCPPGLEYLTQIDQILIHQQIELLEVITGFETANKYEIKNVMGQRVYFATEENDCCTRNCCGPLRPFTMEIVDNMGHTVILLTRPLRCATCWCPCCLQELWHPCLPKFTIQNEAEEDIFTVVGPCIVCSCCEDINFEVKTTDEQYSVGRISKQWTGLVRELFTDTDNFGVQFPLDLDVKMKAVLLGACFLIDFMFFEQGYHRHQRMGVW